VIALILAQLLAIPYLLSHYRGVTPPREVLLADKTLTIIVMAGLLPAHLITLLIVWAVATRWRKFPAKQTLGWSWTPEFTLRRSVLMGVFLFLTAWFISILLGGQETELERILLSSRAAALIIAFVAVATAPLVEEAVYRGILYPALQRTTGTIPAIIIVTLMFAGPHVPQYWPNIAAISSIALLSVVLTTVRAKTGRLLPCFVIHLVFNGIQSIIIVFEPYLRAAVQHWQPQVPKGALVYLMRFLV
jgi:membrane protease YdiL (CAAX protease family)